MTTTLNHEFHRVPMAGMGVRPNAKAKVVGVLLLLARILHQCIKQIARLKFAIGVLLICSFFGAIGTIFEQNQSDFFLDE